MDKEMDVDFFFGDKYLDVKKMDYSLISHKVTEVKNYHLGPVMWQTGIVKLAFSTYDKYIVLGEPMCLSTWMLLIFARILGKKTFFWTHGWYGRESKIKSLIKKVFFGLATSTMTYGEYARALMIREGFDPQNVFAIYNSLMYDEQLPIRKELHKSTLYSEHFQNDFPTVIFIGRLTKVKKLDQIIEAMTLTKGDGYNVVFVGDGEERESLVQKVDSYGLSNKIWFYGPCYDEKVLSQIIYDADLCVAPGNIGLTAVHAMGYGCPCISHDDFKWQMPEFEAIKKGVTGEFFERDDVQSLSQCIDNWFEKHRDDREEIRQLCFSEVDEKWNPHNQLKIIKRVVGV